ncbi:MAG TPA: acyl-CoA dehydrogenase family protein [Steroidobacteraceae bacterium]
MNDSGNLIADTTRRIFRDLGDPRAIKGQDDGRLWNALETAGLTRTWIPETLNGSGAPISEGFEVLRIAGEYAVSIPLGETLLAGWLLQQAGTTVPDGVITLAPVDIRDQLAVNGAGRLSGSARAVPFARVSSRIALLARRDQKFWVSLVDRSLCEVTEHSNLAQDSRDTIALRDAAVPALSPTSISLDDLMLMGAAVRCVQMAGALQGILDLSVSYANQRVAFEKPIGKFQAIQHSLARLAGEAAAALASAGSAADAISSAASFDMPVLLEVASAKIRVGEAAESGAAIAHQVHGAIGFSKDHVLHRFTQRLWSWRDDFGSESYWAVKLGQLVAKNGADALWPMLAER